MTDLLAPSAMNSPPGVRLGSQTPRVRSAPPYDHTLGPEVVDFMSEIGRPLDPWQALIVHDAFGIRADGLWSAYELLVLVARQNGKGGVTEAIELGGLFLFREPLILHSAHQFKTSTAAFRRLQDIIDASDWLRRRVKMISRSKGDESIELTAAAGGGRLQFVARTDGSGRGLTGSKNIFDEAAWLTVGQFAAQTPTLSTIPNPQIIYTSTPPDEDIGPMPEDAMLPSVRRRGMKGGDRTALYEWSPPKLFDRTDPQVWYDCNPALGIRIADWFLKQQLDAFTEAGRPGKFDTEHLGLWPDDVSEQWQVIGKDEWEAAWDPKSQIEGVTAFGFDVSWDRSKAAVGVGGRRPDGLRHGELVKYDDGTGWVVPWVVARVEKWQPCAVVVQPGSPGGSLLPDLERELGELAKRRPDLRMPEILRPSIGEVGQATGSIFDGIAGKDLGARDVRLRGLPELTKAAAGAAWRKVGEATVWDRRGANADICPLMAVTLALLGHATTAHLWQGNYNPLNNLW